MSAPLPMLPSLPTLRHTKLYPPRLGPTLISRPRLVGLMERTLACKVALVVAPAGAGKSTLVQQWLNEAQTPVAWLSLDEGDNDLLRFLTHLLAALHRVAPDACPATMRLLGALYLPLPEEIVTSLTNECARLPQRVVLVLDDYQNLHTIAIHHFITGLLDSLPPTLHLVLLTRHDPPLPLARWRGRGEMVEIRLADLSFTLDEAHAFLTQALPRPLSSDLVVTLHERTEGWAVGLQLAALSMQGAADYRPVVAAFKGTHRYISEYLLEEVIRQQPPPLRDFLLHTALLERFCADLCDALTPPDDGQPSGRAHLARLRQANFFLMPLDEQDEWYRYHYLFRELLRHHLTLEVGPEGVARLHARAAGWLTDHGYLEEALHHWLAAGEPERAAHLVEEQRHTLLNQVDFHRLEGWLRLLPAALLAQRPALLVAQAWIRVFQFYLAALPPLLHQAQRLLDDSTLALPESESSLLRIEIDHLWGTLLYLRGEGQASYTALQTRLAPRAAATHPFLYGRSVLYLSLASQMVGQVEYARHIIHEALQSAHPHPIVLTMRLLGALVFIGLLEGDLGGAQQATAQARSLVTDHDLPHDAAWLHYLSGSLHYQWNNLELAQRHLLDASAARPFLEVRTAVDSMVLLSLTYHAQGHAQAANESVAHLLDYTRQMQNPAYLEVARACQARLALARGEVEAALRWLHTADLTLDGGTMMFWAELPRLTACRVLLAEGSVAAHTRARADLERHLHFAEATHNRWQQIEILVLSALAQQAQGQEEAALALTERAVILARPGGFVRAFVDHGPLLAALLHTLLARGVAPTYLAPLLTAFGNHVAPLTPDPTVLVPFEPLSERELDVLRLLAQRLSDKEIARVLGISPLTVRTHNSRLYHKLGVTSRAQALVRAQALGLVP